MELKDVLSLRWGPLDWRDLKGSVVRDLVSKEDIDKFVTNQFYEVAQTLNIPLEQLLPILQQKNQQFFQLKEHFFSKEKFALAINSVELNMLKKYFIIPSIKDDKVLQCLILFETMTPKEQKAFLTKANQIFSSRT